jgi:hypothetical protein
MFLQMVPGLGDCPINANYQTSQIHGQRSIDRSPGEIPGWHRRGAIISTRVKMRQAR